MLTRSYNHETNAMIILDVPYKEKDEAYELGAKWNWEDKYWYIPKGVPPQKFKKWLPEGAPEFNDRDTIQLFEPVYLARSKSKCWSCSKITPVFCLCANGFEDEDNDPYDDYSNFFIDLWNLKHCIEDLQQLIDQHAPGYTKNFSKQAGERYIMNHCKHCGVKLGDFFMHGEADGAFSPMNKTEAQRIVLHEIKGLKGHILVSAKYSLTMPNSIYNYSPRGKTITVGKEKTQKAGVLRKILSMIRG